MRDTFEKVREESIKMTLDESERQAMRESLMSYMEKNPIREPVLAQGNQELKSWGKPRNAFFLALGLFTLIAIVVFLFTL